MLEPGTEATLARRFTRDELSELIETAGLTVTRVHGVRIFADLVPGGMLDVERVPPRR